jgi:hypothetical protein
MTYFDAQDGRPTAAELAESLIDFVAGELLSLANHHAAAFVLPRIFAGHGVGEDARSDLANTLGLLFEAGREELAGHSLPEVVLKTLCFTGSQVFSSSVHAHTSWSVSPKVLCVSSTLSVTVRNTN